MTPRNTVQSRLCQAPVQTLQCIFFVPEFIHMAARCPGVSITVLWLPLTPVLCVQCDFNLVQDEDRVLWLVGEKEDSLSEPCVHASSLAAVTCTTVWAESDTQVLAGTVQSRLGQTLMLMVTMYISLYLFHLLTDCMKKA